MFLEYIIEKVLMEIKDEKIGFDWNDCSFYLDNIM